MDLSEQLGEGMGLGEILPSANLLLASPIRRPIDPARALAILVTQTVDAATAGAGGLRQAAETLAWELGEALGLPQRP